MNDEIARLIECIGSKGDLNYAICELVGRLIMRDGERISYRSISEWIDAVHGAERELTRRILDPYEDKKKQENGDVPSFEAINGEASR
jgi:hypothetical protein